MKAKGRMGAEVEVMTSGELMARLGRKAEGVNLLEIEKYLRESKVCDHSLCYVWRSTGCSALP